MREQILERQIETSGTGSLKFTRDRALGGSALLSVSHTAATAGKANLKLNSCHALQVARPSEPHASRLTSIVVQVKRARQDTSEGKRRLMSDDQTQISCASLLKVLADETRLAVVRQLIDGPKHVGEINE